MATVTWVVFRHHKKTDGTFNPKIRISHNGSSSYIATPIFTELVKFKKGASSGTVTSERIKEELDDLVKEYRTIINENQSHIRECSNSRDVVEFINRRNESKDIDFIQYARDYISSIKNEGTRTIKTTGINSLCHYLSFKDIRKLSIHNLTSSFLRGYESWLRTDRVIRVKQRHGTKHEYKDIKKKALNDTGIHSYMGIVQSIFNNALLEYNNYETGDIIVSNNPFKAYKIPSVLQPEKRAVDADILRKIYAYSSTKENIQFTRDIYILSFILAGMNVVDMLNCKICNNHIEYERQKTKGRRRDKAFISVCIHPIAMDIIEKYQDRTGKNTFDFLDRYADSRSITKAIHRGMKKICQDLGIDYIQFYSARHSFATIARNDCGFSKDDIALCLNHSSGRTVTDSYIKEDFAIIEKVINRVIEYVFGYRGNAGG